MMSVLLAAILFESPLTPGSTAGWKIAPTTFAGGVYRLEASKKGYKGPPAWAGDESWREYRVEIEILPEKGFAGLEYHVQNDGASSVNVHFYAGDAAVQPAGIWNDATAWKLWPYADARRPLAKGQWLKLRIDAGERVANIYVNGEPVVSMRETPYAAGGVRPWVWEGSARFRNLKVTALEQGSVKPLVEDPWTGLNQPGVLREWRIGETVVKADPRGVVNLTRAFPRANVRNAVFAETVVRAEKPGMRKAYVTYTDRFQVWCNGKPVFEGRPRGWFDPERKKLGNARLVPGQFEIELPLEAGENAIRVRSEVTEPFGWGFWMRVISP